jgi:peptidyl-prolyl cis-trans isomerase SurA
MTLPGNYRLNHPAFRRNNLAIVLATALFCGLFGSFAPLSQAHAQAIITTVNGNPITDLDLGQRMKLLRVLRKPASRDAALQSLIDDKLRLQETGLYQVKATDTEIGQEIVRTANDMKISPETLLSELQRAGVSEAHFKEHFAAVTQFDGLIQAFHKGVEPSEEQVRAEMAKESSKGTANTEYRLNQVIFVVPTSANSLAAVKGRMEAAQQLRARFSDCASGLPLARGMDNVAVKDEINRTSAQLNAPLRLLLEKTAAGHLTPPQRTSEGIEMLAVCSKGASTDDSAVRAAAAAKLVFIQTEAAAEKRLKDLRAHAVIVKR